MNVMQSPTRQPVWRCKLHIKHGYWMLLTALLALPVCQMHDTAHPLLLPAPPPPRLVTDIPVVCRSGETQFVTSQKVTGPLLEQRRVRMGAHTACTMPTPDADSISENPLRLTLTADFDGRIVGARDGQHAPVRTLMQADHIPLVERRSPAWREHLHRSSRDDARCRNEAERSGSWFFHPSLHRGLVTRL